MAYDPSTILRELIKFSLAEDLSDKGDITTKALVDDEIANVKIVSRQSGILSGLKTLSETINYVDPTIVLEVYKTDGDELNSGDEIAKLNGSLASILTLERTALNFLCHLSGIASLTSEFVNRVKDSGSKTIIRDTRKTLPGYRALEKQAVLDGGGQNHRFGLYDAFLVKDNHISRLDLHIIAQRCREFNPDAPLEIEVDSIEQLRVIVQYNPDVILLDNFSVKEVEQAINIASDIDLEVSGGVNLDNVVDYAKTGVKYIAIGELTHSAKVLDIGFDI